MLSVPCTFQIYSHFQCLILYEKVSFKFKFQVILIDHSHNISLSCHNSNLLILNRFLHGHLHQTSNANTLALPGVSIGKQKGVQPLGRMLGGIS